MASNQFEEERATDVKKRITDVLIEEDKKDSVEFEKEKSTNLVHLCIVMTISMLCVVSWFVLSCKQKAEEKKYEQKRQRKVARAAADPEKGNAA